MNNISPTVYWTEATALFNRAVNNVKNFFDEIAEDLRSRELRHFTERLKLTADELERIQKSARWYLGRVLRPLPLVDRQWYRPTRVNRACGSRHRVMLG